MLTKKQSNQEVVLAIFAHPDDEAFGPGGTLAKLSQENEVHLICVTNGEAGGNRKDLDKIRSAELQNSAKVLGIHKVQCLNYKDGTLSNSIYHKLASDLEKQIETLKPKTIITFEPMGISGHIDHITVSLVTTFVSRKFKFINKIMYHCSDFREVEDMQDYFVYFPPGFKRDQVDEVIDITEFWETKVKAMHCHMSQIADVKMILDKLKKLPKEEYFLTSIVR